MIVGFHWYHIALMWGSAFVLFVLIWLEERS